MSTGSPAQANVPLASLTTFRVGGPAARLIEVDKADDVATLARECDRVGEPLLILAGGSNLLISDDGFPGTVLRLVGTGRDVTADGEHVLVKVAAGEVWDDLVAWSVAEGLGGIEALSGIPGSAGATPIQNVGAYGQEVADVVTGVDVWDRLLGAAYTLAPENCQFAYRDSLFKRTGRFVVTGVTFRLTRGGISAPVRYAELARTLGVQTGESAPVDRVRETVLALRRSKGMVLDGADHDTWSAGSFFTNPILDPAKAEGLPAEAPRYPAANAQVKTSAAWLIEHAGFAKGHGNDRASLSTKHTLALTNRGTATAADLLSLAREVRDGVHRAFGIVLHHEPVLVGLTL